MITEFYTIIGFGPDDKAISETATSWNATRGVRSYTKLGAARASLKQASLPGGYTYRILKTVVLHGGIVTTYWFD